MKLLHGLLLFVTGTCLCLASEPAWGRAENGLRLGLSAETIKGGLAVVLSFQNVTLRELSIPVGYATGLGPHYNVQFAATLPNKNCKLADVSNGGGDVAGYMTFVILEIGSHQTQTVTIPMKDLACWSPQIPYRTAVDLLESGYSLNFSFSRDVNKNRLMNLSDAWAGSAQSGVILKNDLPPVSNMEQKGAAAPTQ